MQRTVDARVTHTRMNRVTVDNRARRRSVNRPTTMSSSIRFLVGLLVLLASASLVRSAHVDVDVDTESAAADLVDAESALQSLVWRLESSAASDALEAERDEREARQDREDMQEAEQMSLLEEGDEAIETEAHMSDDDEQEPNLIETEAGQTTRDTRGTITTGCTVYSPHSL
jgi:hypothetical protein